MPKFVAGYLLYLTEDNFHFRGNIVSESISSFDKAFSKQNCDIIVVNNGTIVPPEFSKFNVLNLSKNYYDVAVHYATAFHAEKHNIPYFGYFYEDFIYYDDSFIQSSIDFLENTGIKSMRVPSYKFGDKNYNTTFNPRSVNPDSVRHDVGAGNKQLIQEHVDGRFYRTNWRPNSRPMIWNTKYFLENFVMSPFSRVMQSFEGHMYSVADRLAEKNEWISSFIDGGICSTTSPDLGIREKHSVAYWHEKTVDVEEIKREIK